MAVASATMTPLSTEVPSNKLLQLVAKVDLLLFSFTQFYVPFVGLISALINHDKSLID